MACPLCNREMPPELMEKHHLKTRRVDKINTDRICRECHRNIHLLFSNTDIRDTKQQLDTLEGLLANDRVQKALSFIRKVAPGTSVRLRESRNRKR